MESADPVAHYAGRSISGGRLNANNALGSDGLRVEAAAFNEFPMDTDHVGTLTIQAPPTLFPAGSRVNVDALGAW